MIKLLGKKCSHLQLWLISLLAAIETDFRQCQKYQRDDCEKENTFTTIHNDECRVERFCTGDIDVQNIPSTKLSYICKNSSKMEHVDYVTYCFDASGTWFGFCFHHVVNLTPKSLLANDDQDHAVQDEDKKPTRMTRRSLDTESRYNEFKIIDSQLSILFTTIKELEREKKKNED